MRQTCLTWLPDKVSGVPLLAGAGKAGKAQKDPRNAAGVPQGRQLSRSYAEVVAAVAAGEAAGGGAAEKKIDDVEGIAAGEADGEDGDNSPSRLASEHQREPPLEPLALDTQLESARGLDGAPVSVLAAVPLPPLLYPVLPSTPTCAAKFELHNSSREALQLQLHFMQVRLTTTH